ncbi:platelet-activating factor acetylhydrolase [Mycena metata]|uniref:1-alkyl-2-acetylglycerophosphocholine esterase n=1 Tax=Mycena metata TaxID=1033252 RepID=A0AAD7HZD9_9AGAR|nr:platelet-activating factor acetylhydrolase [Mycena metata]
MDTEQDVPHDALIPESRKRATWGALVSRTLPKYSGPHPVGVCDVELPIPQQTFGTFAHKNLPNAPIGITIDTVLFSLFYPCQFDRKYGRALWFPHLPQTINGFLRMASRDSWAYRTAAYPVAAALVRGTTLPALKDAPVIIPENGSRWPLIILSHGAGSSRLLYSAIAGELASHGYIVAAVEHRDGTGPSSRITTPDGRSRKLDFLNWRDIYWPDHEVQPADDTTLRHDQLKVRLAELRAVQTALVSLSTGAADFAPIVAADPDLKAPAPSFDWTRWAHCLDAVRPIMCGHSFGGTAALAAAASSDFDFSRAVVMDPAVQRLEPWGDRKIPCPLLVLASEEFFHDPDFVRTLSLAPSATSATVLSIATKLLKSLAGTTHPSFSDVFLILPSWINRLAGLRTSPEYVRDVAVTCIREFARGDEAAVRRRGRASDAGRKDQGQGGNEAEAGLGLGAPGAVELHS